jgi:hypothetical protein
MGRTSGEGLDNSPDEETSQLCVRSLSFRKEFNGLSSVKKRLYGETNLFNVS